MKDGDHAPDQKDQKKGIPVNGDLPHIFKIGSQRNMKKSQNRFNIPEKQKGNDHAG